MNLALLQAKKNLGNTHDNPSVGCVITKNNKVISAACTSMNGRPHAEFNAIKKIRGKYKNCNLYVTLEPCSHYGKTPPCTNLILKRNFNKVFFSINDPDDRSYNKCVKILKNKNIIVNKGIISNKINKFYRSYIKYKKSLFPFITCKLAVSKDFFTINNKERWITNEFSRGRVHLMRSNHDCVICSSKTIIDDNPRLTCRINGLERLSPARIIFDRKLKISINTRLIKESIKYRTIIFYNKINSKKIRLLKKHNVEVYKAPLNNKGYLDLKKTLVSIKKLGFSRIFLETGIKLTTSFLEAGLVDDLILFVSNKRLGNNGSSNMKKYFKLFLKNKKMYNEKINLFGDKILTYKIK